MNALGSSKWERDIIEPMVINGYPLVFSWWDEEVEGSSCILSICSFGIFQAATEINNNKKKRDEDKWDRWEDISFDLFD